jgi:hypothetical protein
MDLNFDQIVGNGSGEALQRPSGVLNVLVKDSHAGPAMQSSSKTRLKVAARQCADAHLS